MYVPFTDKWLQNQEASLSTILENAVYGNVNEIAFIDIIRLEKHPEIFLHTEMLLNR